MKKQISVIFIITCFYVPVSYGQVKWQVRSSFDDNFDGWSGECSGFFEHSFSDTEHTGFIMFSDESGVTGDGFIVAPESYLGDWSDLDGIGELSWEHKIFQAGGGPVILRPHVMISGPGGRAVIRPLEKMRPYWRSFSVPIDRDAWTVTSGTWSQLISNVTELKIRIEAAHNDFSPLDINGIDSIVLGAEKRLRFDFDKNGTVDFADFTYFASEWLKSE